MLNGRIPTHLTFALDFKRHLVSVLYTAGCSSVLLSPGVRPETDGQTQWKPTGVFGMPTPTRTELDTWGVPVGENCR